MLLRLRLRVTISEPRSLSWLVYNLMAGPPDKASKVRHEAHQLRLAFITTGLQTSRAFASLATTEYEIGDWDASEHCKERSERAYASMVRFVSSVACSEERLGFERILQALRQTLDHLHQRINK